MSLQKLLVRDKAGQESRGIYLISSNPADPEMFELKVHKPKDKQVWIQAIRYFATSERFLTFLYLLNGGLCVSERLFRVVRKMTRIVSL